MSDDWTPTKDPDCTPRVVPPLLDSAASLVSMLLAGGFYLLADGCDPAEDNCSRNFTPAYIYGGIGLALGASAGLGYYWRGKCQRAHDAHDAATRSKQPAHSAPSN